MFCTQRGASLDAKGKYCGNCGITLTGLAQVASVGVAPTPPARKAISNFWFNVAGFLWVGQVVSMFLGAFSGRWPDARNAIALSILTAVLFAVWSVREGHKGLHAALIGAGAGIAAYMLVASIVGAIGVSP